VGRISNAFGDPLRGTVGFIRNRSRRRRSAVNNPRLSVILVTPDSYRRIRRTIQCLRRQTVFDQMEVVIASPNAHLPDAQPTDWGSFSGVKLVATGPFRNTGHPRAVAVRHASADVVAFAEDHCFPQPDWAETLAQLDRLPW